jgi:hypothetical protein
MLSPLPLAMKPMLLPLVPLLSLFRYEKTKKSMKLMLLK